VFSTRNVPNTFKIGIAFFVSIIVFSAIGLRDPMEIDGMYILDILKEVLVGLLLGFVSYLYFTAIQVAGSFIDIQMGFGMANVFDPMTGASSPMIGNFKFTIAMLLFLSLNGHHFLLKGIMDSYQWVPLQGQLFERIYSGEVSQFILTAFAEMFSIAFQLAAPLIVALFLTDTGLGILAKVAPQFNIFVIGMPLKILIGFLILFLLTPAYLQLFEHLFSTMFESMQKLIRTMAGGPS
jgi:flagellar biosynthetic protein FliR